jgi:hypothetical protein
VNRTALATHRLTLIAEAVSTGITGTAGGFLFLLLLERRWADTVFPLIAMLLCLALSYGVIRLRLRRGLSRDVEWKWTPRLEEERDDVTRAL